jgi:hypothetical protein
MVTWTDDAPHAVLHDNGVEETLDDVYGGMVLATIIVLSATVTGMVLLAAGVWLVIKLIGG